MINWRHGDAWPLTVFDQPYLRRYLRALAPVLGTVGLPGGRKARQLERWRRLRVLRDGRRALLAVLELRFVELLPELPPQPVHGRRCPPGCEECQAVQRWREDVARLFGVVERGPFPPEAVAALWDRL